MDHIPLPSDDLAHAPMEVPLLGPGGPDNFTFHYDDGGMLTFPARVGVHPVRLAAGDHPAMPLPGPAAAAFLQAWLWCGLLQEVLSVGFRTTTAPRRSDAQLLFIRRPGPAYSGRRPVVSLRRLPEVLAADAERARAPVAREWQRERTLSCIDAASRFIEIVFRTPMVAAKLLVRDDRGRLPDTTAVLLSIQVLCQALLENLAVPLYSDSKATGLSLLPPPPQSTHIVDFLLGQSQWQVWDINRLPRDIVFRYHLSFYRRHLAPPRLSGPPQPEVDSRFMPVVPAHTHAGCQCSFISASIHAPLSAEDFILVRFARESGSVATAVVRPGTSATTCPPFLAISHVRSTGLGNDADQSLPSCQLARLQSLADTMCAAAGTFFWVDSLCLPHDRLDRRRMARAVWRVFRAATTVAVLDPPLFLHLVSSAEEALLRIRYSSWKSRLWTLEEGFFASRLVICFADRAVPLEQLLADFERSRVGTLPGKVQILRPCEPFLRPVDEARLPDLLISLGSDVRLFLARVAQSEEQPIHRDSLQRLLRLAYLLAGRFMYFLEEDEARILPGLWRNICKLYSGILRDESGGSKDPAPAGSETQDARERINLLVAYLDKFPESEPRGDY